MVSHQPDTQTANNSSSACTTNFCCTIVFDQFILEPDTTSSYLFTPQLSGILSVNSDTPYKPPKG